MSVTPSPIMTRVLTPRSFFIILATMALPPEDDVGWLSSKPA